MKDEKERNKKPKLTANEILEIVNSQWADKWDFYKLSPYGINKSTTKMQELITKLKEEGYMLPRGLVPMEKVIDELKINISFLKKVAKNE